MESLSETCRTRVNAKRFGGVLYPSSSSSSSLSSSSSASSDNLQRQRLEHHNQQQQHQAVNMDIMKICASLSADANDDDIPATGAGANTHSSPISSITVNKVEGKS